MQHALRAIVASLAAVVMCGVLPSAAPATAAESTVSGVVLNGYERALLTAINGTRGAHGLHPLTVAPGTTDVARRWSWHLAGARQLSHNPSLVTALEHAGSGSWTMIAENVGTASATDPHALFAAYMASPPHRANILAASARYVGIGVVQRGTSAWNTIDFTNAYSTGYGRSRVPAAGMTLDTVTVDASGTIASLESPDQRVATAANGQVAVSQIGFTGPTSGNDRAYATLRRTGSTGRADLYLRAAYDLRNVRSLSVQLAALTANGGPLTVQVVASRSYVSAVSLGYVHVSPGVHWFTLTLPAAARVWRDGVLLRVTNGALAAVGGRATISVYAVTANV